MKDAINAQRQLDSLTLRTRRSDQGSLEASGEALAAAAKQPIEALVKQLQACVLWLGRPSIAGEQRCNVWVSLSLPCASPLLVCPADHLPTTCHPAMPTSPSQLPGMPRITAVHTADAVANLMLFGAAAGGHAAVAQLVLLLSPSAATTRQGGGQLPIHVAASGCHLDCLATLLGRWPATVLSTDRHGYLPLHRAAAASQGGEREHHAEAVRLLLAAAPQTATATTAQVGAGGLLR